MTAAHGSINYMREITAFYEWLNCHPLTPAEIALWHALMHIANRAFWPKEITVSASALTAKAQMREKALYHARTRLVRAGRISYRSRRGNQSAVYTIIPLTDEKGRVVMSGESAHAPSFAPDAPEKAHESKGFGDATGAAGETNGVTNGSTNGEAIGVTNGRTFGIQSGSIYNNKQKQETKTSVCEHARAFQKPSFEQVEAYCAERGRDSPDFARRFFDYYEANGWLIGGKAPMRDWRAAVRSWETNGIARTGGQQHAVESLGSSQARNGGQHAPTFMQSEYDRYNPDAGELLEDDPNEA